MSASVLTGPAVGALPDPGLAADRHVLGRDHHRDRMVRLATGVLVWLSLLLVTYLWDIDGGITDLTDWTAGLTSIGRLSGLWASDLLLIQVLLMARLPFLEHSFGRDELTRVHRLVGFASFSLMLVHIVTIIWGYASAEWSLVPSTTWDLLVNYGGMLLALAGTICLAMVVVTSVKVARRKLRYESWHLLHLYAYLGVGLALPHQLWTGQQFLNSPLATVYWWSLWTVTTAAVLVWRLVLPTVRSLRHDLRVTAVVQEAPDVVSVYLTGRRLDLLPTRAGQFITVRFLNGAGWSRGNPYSLSAAPDGRGLRITAKTLGDGSARLSALQPGTRVWFEGPYGRLTDRARTRRGVVLAGAGVGITPLRSLVEGLPYAPGEAVLLQRYTDEPLFARELDVLAARRGVQVVFLPGHRPHPDSVLGPAVRGLDERTALHRLIPNLAERDIYLCGPKPWTDGFERLVLAAGVPRDRIHTESFGG